MRSSLAAPPLGSGVLQVTWRFSRLRCRNSRGCMCPKRACKRSLRLLAPQHETVPVLDKRMLLCCAPFDLVFA